MDIGSYVVEREQPPLAPAELATVRAFHELYYGRWQSGSDTINLSWFGHQTLKCPLDLWMYQELLVRTRPDVVIEAGTWQGGSALYLAMILEAIGNGRVVTIDIQRRGNQPQHPRLEYLEGSSTDPEIIARVHDAVRGMRAMVILDSDHRAAHVYDEMVAYAPLIAVGDYLIVEDTNVNGHPAIPDFGPGPMEAVDRFLAGNDDFAVDANCERFLMTLNPRGYLRRTKAPSPPDGAAISFRAVPPPP